MEVFVAPHCGDELGRGYPRVWANGEPVAEWYTQTAVFEFMAPFFFLAHVFLGSVSGFFLKLLIKTGSFDSY